MDAAPWLKLNFPATEGLVCSSCGAEVEPCDSSWRSTGIGWEHSCPDRAHPQVGHMAAVPREEYQEPPTLNAATNAAEGDAMNDDIVERYRELARPDDEGLVHRDHVEPLLTEIERLRVVAATVEGLRDNEKDVEAKADAVCVENATQRAENATLRGVVEKLPVDAEGKYVVPGVDAVFVVLPAEIQGERVWATKALCIGKPGYDGWTAHRWGEDIPVSQCYLLRAAAEAAAQGELSSSVPGGPKP